MSTCNKCKHYRNGRQYSTTYTKMLPVKKWWFSKPKEEMFTTVSWHDEPPYCTRYPKWRKVASDRYCGEFKEAK